MDPAHEVDYELRYDPLLADHLRTYKAFNMLLRWCMVVLGSGMLMLTLWFATGTGFLGSLLIGLATFALAFIVLIRHEPQQPGIWGPGH